MGAREALGEDQDFIETDGIQITSNNFNAVIGTALEYSHPLSWVDGGNYFMLDHESRMDGIFLNEKTWQDGGNIKQIGSTEARIGELVDYLTPGDPSWQDEGVFWNQGIIQIGNEIWTVEGRSAVGSLGGIPTGLNGASLKGVLKHYEIQGSDLPREINFASGTGQSSQTVDLQCGQGHIVGAALCDIAASGRYMYLVNNQNPVDYSAVAAPGVSYSPTYFQIVEDGFASGNEGAWGRHIIQRSRMNDTELEGAWRVLPLGNHCVVATNRLRQFGQQTDTAWQNFDKTGYMTLVNVENPDSPRVVSDSDEVRLHHLAITQASSRYIAALSIKIGSQSGGGGSNVVYAGFDVKLNIYSTDIESYSIIDHIEPRIYHDFESTIVSSATPITKLNHQDHKVINKFGAIESDGRYIYVLYQNGYYLYDVQGLDDCSNNQSDVGSPKTITFADSDTISGTNITSSAMVTDCTIIGNSLYILYSEASGGANYDPDHTYILKLDITDPLNPVTVYDKLLESPVAGVERRTASRIVSVGNNIYASVVLDDQNPGIRPGLIPIEVDGIEADAAQLGSLRADHLAVTEDSNIRGNLDLGSNLAVGGRSFFQGQVSIKKGSKLKAGWIEWKEGMWMIQGDLNTSISTSLQLGWDPNSLGILTSDTDSDLRIIQNINSYFATPPPTAWTPGGGIELVARDKIHIGSRDLIRIDAIGDVDITGEDVTIEADGEIFINAPDLILIATDQSSPGSIELSTAALGATGDVNISTGASAQVTITGGDSLVVGLPGDEGVVVNGENHIPKLGQIITAQPNESILLSGTVAPVSGDYRVTWQRVGNVVHVNGSVNCQKTGGTGIPMPIVGPGGSASIEFFEGNGTLGASPSFQAVEVKQVFGTTDIRIVVSGGGSPTNNTARINYSYVLV
jgi:hypothetical protein